MQDINKAELLIPKSFSFLCRISDLPDSILSSLINISHASSPGLEHEEEAVEEQREKEEEQREDEEGDAAAADDDDKEEEDDDDENEEENEEDKEEDEDEEDAEGSTVWESIRIQRKKLFSRRLCQQLVVADNKCAYTTNAPLSFISTHIFCKVSNCKQ